MYEDQGLDGYWEAQNEAPHWADDDLYLMNQAEADDYRYDMEGDIDTYYEEAS